MKILYAISKILCVLSIIAIAYGNVLMVREVLSVRLSLVVILGSILLFLIVNTAREAIRCILDGCCPKCGATLDADASIKLGKIVFINKSQKAEIERLKGGDEK